MDTLSNPARRWRSAAGVLLLLIAFVWLGAASVAGKSRTHDEESHLSYGRQVLEQGSFERLVHQHNATSPWIALNAAPVRIARQLGLEIADGRTLYWSRLPTLLVGALLALAVFAWARRAFGSAAGWLALTLCCFSPNLLAHSRLVTTDLLTSLGVVATLYALWRLTEEPLAGRMLALRACAAGAALGFALSTKLSSVYLVPLAALLLLAAPGALASPGPESSGAASAQRRPRLGSRLGDRSRSLLRSRRRPIAALAIVYLAALVTLNSCYLWQGSFDRLADDQWRSDRFTGLAASPLVGRLPLPLPRGYVQGLDWVSEDFERPRWSYLLGRYSQDGFPHYYLVAFGAKSTPGFLALLLLALFAAGAAAAFPDRLRRWQRGLPEALALRRVDFYLLLPAACYFLYLSLAVHFQIGLRHLLFVYPLLFVFVSRLAAAWRSPAEDGRRRRWLLPAAAGALAVAHAISALSVYPHFLPYFNRLAGGPLAGWHLLIDSNLDWAQDRGRALHVYLPASPVPIAVGPGGPTAGRVMINVNKLVGLTPGEHERYRWLRENFAPVDHVGYSWLVYDVDEEALARCCGDLFVPLPGPPGNLAPAGRAIGGVLPAAGEGAGEAAAPPVRVIALDRLNDGQLGSNSNRDAARTHPIASAPVAAWFGIAWPEERQVRRLVAYPTLFTRGPRQHAFMPVTARFQAFLDGRWTDLPGGHLEELESARIELSFPPVRTRKVRLLIERQRNHRGLVRPHGRFRAACLELAAY